MLIKNHDKRSKYFHVIVEFAADDESFLAAVDHKKQPPDEN